MLLTHSLSTGINHIKCTLLLLFLNVAMIKLISDYTFKTGSHYSLHFFFFFFCFCTGSSVSHCKFTQSTLHSEHSASEPLSALRGNVGQVIFLVGQGCSRIHFFQHLQYFTFFFLQFLDMFFAKASKCGGHIWSLHLKEPSNWGSLRHGDAIGLRMRPFEGCSL